MRVVAFLPAKGTSSRIESKNMKLLDGRPLFLHTLEKLVSCDFIDQVYLDSDSDEILSYASYLSYQPMKRDPALANNQTDGNQMFYNEVKQADADIYIQILGTSPFIKKETIKKGVDFLQGHPDYDSVVLVKKEKQYTWENGRPKYDKCRIPNSIELPDTWIETMGLYIMRSDAAHRLKQRIGERAYMLEAEPIEAIDINFPEDFVLAEAIARGIRQEEVRKFEILSKHLSSCIFSDILWDFHTNASITGLSLNLPGAKLLGRANTLKIRRLRDGEDFRGIYDGLETYKKVRSGEILVVENECSDYAYFGELNSNLAIRSGAIGAVIDGVTRDQNEVSALGYPVFSAGACCTDVRGIGTVESHNKVITVRGVTVHPGDLVFADVNGIAVIPKHLEDKVLALAIKAVETEKSVLSRIMDFEDAYHIYQEEGAF